MSKEKQIEEMASFVCSSFHGHHDCENCSLYEERCCVSFCASKRLYNAGYRKQSDKDSSKGCEYCKGRAYTKKPLTVITKYGRRIELVFEFCPNCGRKMKGGAE